jgi:putative hemolysin
MSPVALEVLFIAFLLIGNGVFAMSETAIISARKVRLQQRAEEGDKKAQAALELATNPHDFLATVQIGITLVGILAGAFGGATISQELELVLARIAPLAPYSEALSLVIVVLVITYLSLVIGELVPKSLALNNPERIASLVAQPMRLLARIAAPIVYLLSRSTNLALRLMGVKSSEEPPVTEEEVRLMIDLATQTGTFQAVESQMVEQVFRIGDMRIGGLMTPRTEIVWMDTHDSPEEILRKIAQGGFSRYPIAEGMLDKVVGVVPIKDLLIRQLSGEVLDLIACLQKPIFVPETTSVLRVVKELQQNRGHIALVIDEYGGVQGLVTLNKILEEIIRHDLSLPSQNSAEPQAIRRDDGSWLLDGMVSVDRLKELLTLKTLPGEDKNYQTLGGFVMAQIDRVPVSGDHFEVEGIRFEIMDMDGYRVDKVLVTVQDI